MKEPFEIVSRDAYPEVPSFGPSALVGEYWSTYLNIVDKKPITDALNDIFDKGNEVHHAIEVLEEGGRHIISCEAYIKVIHESKTFCIGGLHDYIKMYFGGLYLEDMKSTKAGGLHYFFRNGVDLRYKLQMSLYAYLYYVKTGVWINKGVITKVNKENILDRVSMSADLCSREYIRKYILNHPVILCVIGKITQHQLLALAAQKLLEMDNGYASGKKDLPWVCDNCQYLGKTSVGNKCALLNYIDEEKLK